MIVNVKPEPYIRHGERTFLVPSAHGQLGFAQLTYAACEELRPEVIAVELPRQLQCDEVLARMATSNGAPALIMIEKGEAIEMAVPSDDDSQDTVVRPVVPSWSIPVSSTDSIALAVRMPRLLRARYPGWQPEVRCMDADPQSESRLRERRGSGGMTLPDDYVAVRYGLEEYCRRIGRLVGLERTTEDTLRERVMAANIRRYSQDGKTVLGVIGAAHRRGICANLDQGGAAIEPEPVGTAPLRVSTVPIPPEIAYLQGWIDVPRLAWAFEQACRRGEGATFDKQFAVREMLRTAVKIAQRKRLALSVRRFQAMFDYVLHLTARRGRCLPSLEDLSHAAEACVNREFAEIVTSVALRYPGSKEADRTAIHVLPDDKLLIIHDGRAFLTDRRFHLAPRDSEGVLPVRKWLKRRLSRKERQILQAKDGCYQPSAAESILCARMNDRARYLAHRAAKTTVSLPFDGTNCGIGIDLRRSVRSWATGDRTLFVRHVKRERRIAPCDGMCPIAWIHDHRAVPVYKHSGYHSCQEYAHVYASHYYLSERCVIEGTCHGVRRSRIAYWISLLRELASPHTEANVVRILRALPRERHCRREPWFDSDLRDFHGHEQAIATGIKYAHDHMIVVCDPSLAFGQELTAYARRRRVRIIRLSSHTDFDSARIARSAIDHELVAEGLYSKPHAFLERFVEPIS